LHIISTLKNKTSYKNLPIIKRIDEDEKGGKKYEKDYSSSKICVNCSMNESLNIRE